MKFLVLTDEGWPTSWYCSFTEIEYIIDSGETSSVIIGLKSGQTFKIPDEHGEISKQLLPQLSATQKNLDPGFIPDQGAICFG